MTLKLTKDVLAGAPESYPGGEHDTDVKLVSCILREELQDEVLEAIAALDVVGGITLTGVQGYDPRSKELGQHRGITYPLKIYSRVRLDVAVPTEKVNEVIRTIRNVARTGKTGDGKIFVTDVYHIERIRTGEVNLSAI